MNKITSSTVDPFLNLSSYIPLTLNQLNETYDYVENIIANLDEEAIAELTTGSESDIDKLLLSLLEETNKALHTQSGPIKNSSFGYLEKLTESIEESLRRLSFNYFVMSVLPDFDLSWHIIEWGRLIQLYQYVAFLAARGHSKSYTFSKAYPLWKMYRYEKGTPERRAKREYALSKEGMIITNEFNLAKHFLGMIKEEIETNEILRKRLYPEANREGWGKEEIRCKNGARLMVKSYGSRMRGFHPGWIVNDDFLNESSLYSKEQRDKYISFFHSVVMNMILPQGQVIVAGTPFHTEDLYANLKGSPSWKVFEYPAIMPNGQILWEGRFTLDIIREKRFSQGSINFSREMLVKPISSESSIFPYPLLEKSFQGMDKVTIVNNILSHPKKFVKVVVGCDFAISSSVGSDSSAFAVVGMDELENFWLLHLWTGHGKSYNEQMSVLKRLNSDFRPSIMMMESNGFQQIFIQMAKEANLPVVEDLTTENKKSLYEGLPAMAVLFEQGKIKFPRGDQRSKDVTDTICSELNSITFTDKGKLESVSSHDDTGLALWKAIRGCKYVNQGFKFSFI